MTYKVSSGTLNLYSLHLSKEGALPGVSFAIISSASCIFRSSQTSGVYLNQYIARKIFKIHYFTIKCWKSNCRCGFSRIFDLCRLQAADTMNKRPEWFREGRIECERRSYLLQWAHFPILPFPRSRGIWTIISGLQEPPPRTSSHKLLQTSFEGSDIVTMWYG